MFQGFTGISAGINEIRSKRSPLIGCFDREAVRVGSLGIHAQESTTIWWKRLWAKRATGALVTWPPIGIFKIKLSSCLSPWQESI